jgi:hypothetical protein
MSAGRLISLFRTIFFLKTIVKKEQGIMPQITLDVPEDILVALKSSPETIGDELRMVPAVKLFELACLRTSAPSHAL